jgi:hypothetical protein
VAGRKQRCDTSCSHRVAPPATQRCNPCAYGVPAPGTGARRVDHVDGRRPANGSSANTKPGTVTVAGKPSIDLPAGTLVSIRRQAGLSREQMQ